MYKRNIYIMFFIACLQGMVFYGPVATLYRQAQGVSILQITVIESVSLALCLILEFPWGILADRIGYKRTMIICNVLYFITKIIFWQAQGFSAFLLERILLGVVISGLSGVDTSILYLSAVTGRTDRTEPLKSSDEIAISAATHESGSQHVFGIYNSLGTAGLLIAAFVYSTVIGDDYRLAGFLTMISYGAAAALSLLLQEVKKEEERRTGRNEIMDSLRKVFTNKYLLLFLLGIAFLNESHQTITVFLNQLQYVRAGISPVNMGYIYIAVTVAGFTGVFSEKMTKRIGVFWMIRICFFGAAAVCLCLAFTDAATVSVAGILLLRIVFELMQPLRSELENRQITVSNRATALSTNAMMIDSVGIGTNMLFGTLAKRSLVWAFLLGAVLCLAGGIFMEVWKKEKCTS